LFNNAVQFLRKHGTWTSRIWQCNDLALSCMQTGRENSQKVMVMLLWIQSKFRWAIILHMRNWIVIEPAMAASSWQPGPGWISEMQYESASLFQELWNQCLPLSRPSPSPFKGGVWANLCGGMIRQSAEPVPDTYI
jgi:hypothetical protein